MSVFVFVFQPVQLAELAVVVMAMNVLEAVVWGMLAQF